MSDTNGCDNSTIQRALIDQCQKDDTQHFQTCKLNFHCTDIISVKLTKLDLTTLHIQVLSSGFCCDEFCVLANNN